jgi:hypothetical protein
MASKILCTPINAWVWKYKQKLRLERHYLRIVQTVCDVELGRFLTTVIIAPFLLLLEAIGFFFDQNLSVLR